MIGRADEVAAIRPAFSPLHFDKRRIILPLSKCKGSTCQNRASIFRKALSIF